jgi:deoxyribonuclease-4
MQTVQIFTHSPSQWVVARAPRGVWKAKPLDDGAVERFRAAVALHGLRFPVAHDSYLINLASPDAELWKRSAAAFRTEIERAARLGLFGVVMHPGSALGAAPERGLAQVVKGLDKVHRETPGAGCLTLLETTAGQGTNLGWRFEELAWIRERVEEPGRVGVCVDTCHIFAAGYPIHTRDGYRRTVDELERIVGLEHVKMFHLNDSAKGLGSRVDRHAGIGRGAIGAEPFGWLLRDRRFASLPMCLETPKGKENGEELDAVNLRVLREQASSTSRKR